MPLPLSDESLSRTASAYRGRPTARLDGLKASELTADHRYWRQVDKWVNRDACVAPYADDKAVDLFSSRLKNVYIEPQYGIVDLRAVGVG
jgi:hypothetical protein